MFSRPQYFREGYSIFVKLLDLKEDTPADQFAAAIEKLDEIFFRIIREEHDFFPNPYGGAILLPHVSATLEAAKNLTEQLGSEGLRAGIGIAWGRFQSTAGVAKWNASAAPLNYSARLAFAPAAECRVLVAPKVREDALVDSVAPLERFSIAITSAFLLLRSAVGLPAGFVARVVLFAGLVFLADERLAFGCGTSVVAALFSDSVVVFISFLLTGLRS